MTHAKFIRIAERILTNHAGETIHQQAVALTDAIEMALDLEIDSPPEESAKPAEPAPNAGIKFQPLPVPPAVTTAMPGYPTESSRLIVMPGDPEIKTYIPTASRTSPVPVAHPSFELSAPRTEPLQNAMTGNQADCVWWAVEEMLDVLHKNTPEEIKFTVEHPDRGPVPIKLQRNIVAGMGFDVVKLLYKHTSAGDDLAATETFWLTQRNLPIEESMEKIIATAMRLYSPRERVITPRIPLRLMSESGERIFSSGPQGEGTFS